ncbi:MAG: hypothetical protein IJM57_09415, partial [Lachnospiraceae bacterium]|nr:hypothetical protein [Lachnospiraceae bacterium]
MIPILKLHFGGGNSVKKKPSRYKARKQSFPAENHRRNSLPENFMKIFDVTIDTTSKARYIMTARCNQQGYNNKSIGGYHHDKQGKSTGFYQHFCHGRYRNG